MSTYYNVFEKFTISEVTEKHNDFIAVLKTHLATVNYLANVEADFHNAVLDLENKEVFFKPCSKPKEGKKANNPNEISEAVMLADGKEYKDIPDILNVLDNATEFEIRFSYTIVSTLGMSDAMFNMAFINGWTNFLEAQDEEFLSTVYCAAWFSTDNNDENNGKLFAYGEKNGEICCGEIPFIEVEEAPEALWYTGVEALYFETEEYDEHKAEIDAVIEKIAGLCEGGGKDLNLTVEEESFVCYVNCCGFTTLQLLELVSCASEINKIVSDAYIVFTNEYYEIGSKLLHIDVDDDYNITGFAVAEI